MEVCIITSGLFALFGEKLRFKPEEVHLRFSLFTVLSFLKWLIPVCLLLLRSFLLDFVLVKIGVDFALKVINWDADTLIRLQLWDIAGKGCLLLWLLRVRIFDSGRTGLSRVWGMMPGVMTKYLKFSQRISAMAS